MAKKALLPGQAPDVTFRQMKSGLLKCNVCGYKVKQGKTRSHIRQARHDILTMSPEQLAVAVKYTTSASRTARCPNCGANNQYLFLEENQKISCENCDKWLFAAADGETGLPIATIHISAFWNYVYCPYCGSLDMNALAGIIDCKCRKKFFAE